MTRGYNIVADGWAGASNPPSTPQLPHTLSYAKKFLQKVFKNKRLFPHFWTGADGLTDGPTDGWTDEQSVL